MKITEGLVKISVRELVEFVLRQGSIAPSVASTNRALIGTLAHKKIQDSMEPNYEAEVKLVHECQIDEVLFVIEGRADGIIRDLVSVTIDEIKTTATPLEYVDENFNHLHWAQAKCYAYFYAKEHGLSEMQVRLTYYNIDTKEIKHLEQGFAFNELEQFFNDILQKYYRWIRFYLDWSKSRDRSLRQLEFPFPNYRKGQREVAVSVYKTIKQESKLFINAPTGIGKTISTLFPSLKAMGEGMGSKIFYLTAKTITRTVAEEGVIRLGQQGAKIKSITITAKDKICFCEKRQCHPDFCQWANGHYDRVDEAVYEMISHENLLTREKIEEYARKHQVCPFEMSLDLALWADIVICDYNYVFDPNVGLKRFVDNSEFILLVDEAHNLVDRAREMYSAGLSKKQVLSVKKALVGKEYSSIKKELNKINEYFLELRRTYMEEVGTYITKEPPKSLYNLARKFLAACDQKLNQKGNELPSELIDLYFEVYNFNRCYEGFDKHYICYAEQKGSEVYLKQFCIDPSDAISEITKTAKSAIFFSATLLPIDYFKDMLGGKNEIAINFDSPFEEQHALRMIARDVSTRYKDREESLEKICRYIMKMIEGKKGHYMVFFPSYKYMIDTYEYFIELCYGVRGSEIVSEDKGKDQLQSKKQNNAEHQEQDKMAKWLASRIAKTDAFLIKEKSKKTEYERSSLDISDSSRERQDTEEAFFENEQLPLSNTLERAYAGLSETFTTYASTSSDTPSQVLNPLSSTSTVNDGSMNSLTNTLSNETILTKTLSYNQVKNEGVLIKNVVPYDFDLYIQSGEMSEEERESFLGHFEDESKATVNFCVLGGIFSEGIDLTGEKLIGVAVVGVGIPQIGLERDLIKGYFDDQDKVGYHYAYTYPGMNKVLQAVGRLIRTEEDKGIILLIDDRYVTPLYEEMLPHAYKTVRQKEWMSQYIKEFWKVNG